MAQRSRRTRRERGRPYNPASKRNQRDRAGRRGDVDLGQHRLRARKLRLTSRADLELTPAAALHGGHLDNAQYSALGVLTLLLRRISAAMGRRISVGALWSSIIAAGSR